MTALPPDRQAARSRALRRQRTDASSGSPPRSCLTEIERRFIERRTSEEQSALQAESWTELISK